VYLRQQAEKSEAARASKAAVEEVMARCEATTAQLEAKVAQLEAKVAQLVSLCLRRAQASITGLPR
jgi:peptidoglycan hydrolase CwlO-like protein